MLEGKSPSKMGQIVEVIDVIREFGLLHVATFHNSF